MTAIFAHVLAIFVIICTDLLSKKRQTSTDNHVVGDCSTIYSWCKRCNGLAAAIEMEAINLVSIPSAQCSCHG